MKISAILSFWLYLVKIAISYSPSNSFLHRKCNFIKSSLWIMRKRLNDEKILNEASNLLRLSAPWNAPAFVWSFAIKIHTLISPILHFFDSEYRFFK